jgi:yeast amino acid transporter
LYFHNSSDEAKIRSGGTLAVYAFIGVELVAVTAAEAKYPTHDLPLAFGRIYILAIIIYTLSALLVSLNVPYNDPRLLPLNGVSTILSTRSPFIIATEDAGFGSTLPGFINGCFVFAAFTAA